MGASPTSSLDGLDCFVFALEGLEPSTGPFGDFQGYRQECLLLGLYASRSVCGLKLGGLETRDWALLESTV